MGMPALVDAASLAQAFTYHTTQQIIGVINIGLGAGGVALVEPAQVVIEK